MVKTVDTVVFGTVVTETATLQNACVAIDGGKIVGLLPADAAPEAGEKLEFPGCLIMPGIVDGHVHSRGTPEEGFTNSTRAAAAGGVTTIVDQPSDRGAPVLRPDVVARKVREGEEQCIVDFALWGGANKDSIPHLESMVEAGVVGFKMYMSMSQRMGRMDDGHLLLALQEIGRVNSMGEVHAESFEITETLMEKYQHEGKTGPEANLQTRPDIAELDAVMRGIEYAKYTGGDLHFCHISLAASVDMIHRAQQDNPRLSLETGPQYLLLSDDLYKTLGMYALVSPPLRKAGETEAMWERLRLGKIDIIATDHAPHTHAEKASSNMFETKAGAPGVETSLPMLFSEGVVKRQIPAEMLVKIMSAKPARRFGLYPRKGALLPGSDADLVVLDPRAEWEIRGAQLHQAMGWTPFEGWKVTGKPILSMLRGQAICRDGEVIGAPGQGKFVPSRRPSRVAGAWR